MIASAKFLLAILVIQAFVLGFDAKKGTPKKTKPKTSPDAPDEVEHAEAPETAPAQPQVQPAQPQVQPAQPQGQAAQPQQVAQPKAGSAQAGGAGGRSVNGSSGGDPDADPVPDPFNKHPKWSVLVHRLDAISTQVKALTQPFGKLISDNSLAGNRDGFITFAKNFHTEFKKLHNFFGPLHDELADGAAYTVINPAVGLTDMKTLNEWGKGFEGKSRLDQSKVKWIEVNGEAITVHYIFDRLHAELEKWRLTEVADSVSTEYPSWFHDISTQEDPTKPTYELKKLNGLTESIDSEILPGGVDKNHMMRSLEKLLRKHLSGWDPESDYNIYCYGNNEFGLIHDVFDLLTDAAMYLSLADVKDAILRSTYLLFQSWNDQTVGGEEEDIKNAKKGEDFTAAIDKIFEEMTARINKKVRLAGIEILVKVDVVPGPTTFKCDGPPGDTGKEPTTEQPAGHTDPPTGPKIPPRPKPGGPLPVYPEAQWGKDKPKALSPKAVGPHPYLDPQSGPANPPDQPVGYIDKRQPTFEYASFAQAYSGYLEAETVLNPDGSCKSTCPDFKRPTPTCEGNRTDCTALRSAYCEEGKDCMAKSQCKHNARKCMRASHNVQFCPTKDGDEKTKDRIYEWVDVNGTLVGKVVDDGKRDCKTDIQSVRERWEMDFGVILNAPQYCEVCLCVCDGPMSELGVHYFDIQAVAAEAGHVVTSIRFTQKNNVMRLEIEQGKLNENGAVDQATVKWIESPKEELADPTKTVRLGGQNGFRQISLDQVYGTTTEVVTGLKFVVKNDTLHLSAQLSKVDPNTGALATGNTDWKEGNFPEPDPIRKRISVEDKINPLKQQGPSQPFNLGENKRYIRFDASSLALDAGQSVVPFFDIQPVRHHTIRKPLNAIGILFKAKKGSGGYLSPTVTTFKKFFI